MGDDRFKWTKEDIEFLILNYNTQKIYYIAAHLGCWPKSIYRKIKELNLQRPKHFRHEPPRFMSNAMRASIEKMQTINSVKWPKIETTMAAALRGRSFGGDAAAPGTKKPRTSRTSWTGDIGEYKSSMG